MTSLRYILTLMAFCLFLMAPAAPEAADTSVVAVSESFSVDEERRIVETVVAEADTATPLPVIDKGHILKQPRPDLYQLPYSMWTRRENWGRLAINTGVLFGAGFATLGILELLPEDATAWNKKNIAHTPMFKRWWQHFHHGPVWDSDQPLFNYILHPYAGGAYYMSARSQGFNVLGSFAYCAFISTIFWELGIECFNEVPSIQDLIITPVGGMVLGEAFYLLKRHIVSHDYRLWGSTVLGNAVAFIIDPVNEVLGLIFGNSARQWISYRKQQQKLAISSQWLLPSAAMAGGIAITATF